MELEKKKSTIIDEIYRHLIWSNKKLQIKNHW